ncbi:serine hydrolase [Patescibacteria group bacterium]|nr:serine hydrolase [Patescibacteria group bacterium]
MMRRVVLWFFIGKISLVVLCALALSAYAVVASLHLYGPVAHPSPVFHIDAAAPELTAARSYVVFDAVTGAILAEHDADTAYPIASVTKLPAAALAEVVVPLEATTTLTWSDVEAEGRAGKLEPFQEYTYRELLFPLLLESSNDAAAAYEREYENILLIAMNEMATTYGATRTRFSDVSGLSADNVSSARDLALITTRLYAEHPFVFDITTLTQYIGPYTGWVNNNPVASESGYLGGKHGYTEAAGRTIVALFDEPFVAGRRQLGYVILGSANLKADMSTLRSFVAANVRFE